VNRVISRGGFLKVIVATLKRLEQVISAIKIK